MSDDLRSIWDEEQPLPPASEQPVPPDSPLTPLPGTGTLEEIAAPKAARKRAWEKKHPTASYRGVPLELNTAVLEVTEQLGVTRDEIMHAFLAYAYALYLEGALPLVPRPGPQRMTLFPPGEWTGWRVNREAPTPPASKKAKAKKKPGAQKRWQRVTSFRIPGALKAGLKETAQQNGGVSTGEVVTAFLAKALEDYHAGVLVLTPIAASNTLFPPEEEA